MDLAFVGRVQSFFGLIAIREIPNSVDLTQRQIAWLAVMPARPLAKRIESGMLDYVLEQGCHCHAGLLGILVGRVPRPARGSLVALLDRPEASPRARASAVAWSAGIVKSLQIH